MTGLIDPRYRRIVAGPLWSVQADGFGDELLIAASDFDARSLGAFPELEPCDGWHALAAMLRADSRQVALEILSDQSGQYLAGAYISQAALAEEIGKFIDDRGPRRLYFFRVKRLDFRGTVFSWSTKKDVAPPPQTLLSWFRALTVDELGEVVETAFHLDTPVGARSGALTRTGVVDFDAMTPGVCRLAFPDIDDLCRRSHRMAPAKVGAGDVAYVPGVPLELSTDQSHRVVVPAFRDLRIEWPLDLAADEHTGIETHQFLLEGGSYSRSLTVSDDHADGDHLLSLVFPDLFLGPQYTMKQIDADGSTHAIFVADFGALFSLAPTNRRDWSRVAHREDTGAGA